MVKSRKAKENGNGNGNGGASASASPFLEKSFFMVDDAATDSIISWGPAGDTFVIWDMTQFSVHLLPKFFKHSNFSSFMRQLNIYGFRKVDTDRWEFANDGFIRDQKHLLKNITRRKHPHSNEQKHTSRTEDSSQPVISESKVELLKDVEDLKNDRNVLMREFVKLRQLQETSGNNLLVIRERVQGMEKNQQQLLSFLVMAMQNPVFLAKLFHPKENYYPIFEQERVVNGGKQSPQFYSDGRLLPYEPVMNGLPDPEFSSGSGSGRSNSTPTFDGTEDAFLGIDLMKILLDENSSFTLDECILPGFPEDGSWKELLLASPEDLNCELEGPVAPKLPDTDTKSRDFELLMEQIGISQGPGNNETEFDTSDSDDDQNLELLTEEMENLISGTVGPT